MRKFIITPTLVCLFSVIFLAPAKHTMGSVGQEALKNCDNLAFSIEEDFVTQGPVPPDGNPIISDGDLLGPSCVICARNEDLLKIFEVKQDLGLDAVHIINVDSYLVAFSTELDSPNLGQFTAGDLLATNGAVIPNAALLYQFNIQRADLGLDAVQFVGDSGRVIEFLAFARTLSREEWLRNPSLLASKLDEYRVDILFSTEGTGPTPDKPIFLDGDLLSAVTGTIVAANGDLLPPSVPAGIPTRGVDFGLDAAAFASLAPSLLNRFSTEIFHRGDLNFTDGDLLSQGNDIFMGNYDLIECFEPKANILGLDAFFQVLEPNANQALLAQVKALATSVAEAPHPKTNVLKVNAEADSSPGSNLEPCRELAFSTEEDFLTRGPVPPDGNPIISDGDLLGKGCAVCARNWELLFNFDVSTDLGLDAVDVIDVGTGLVAFSTELDSPHTGQFTSGDLLATNGTIIPNLALLKMFNISYDMGLDALLFVGEPERIAAFFNEAKDFPREYWLRNPDALVGMLREWQIDIWFSTEGTGPLPAMPGFLDGDLLSAVDGVIIASNDILLPLSVPAGIPDRGVDFGLDAVTGHRNGMRELINFSTEILFNGEPGFTDGDVLKLGNGVILSNEDLIRCFEPMANFLGLDALSGRFTPPCEGDFDHDGDVDGYDLAVFAANFGRTDCVSPPPCEGDFDGDNDVDGSDLAVFAADFGRTDCP